MEVLIPESAEPSKPLWRVLGLLEPLQWGNLLFLWTDSHARVCVLACPRPLGGLGGYRLLGSICMVSDSEGLGDGESAFLTGSWDPLLGASSLPLQSLPSR